MKVSPRVKQLLRIVSWTIAVFWLGCAVISMVYVLGNKRSPTGPEFYGYRFMVVLSDSMTPSIHSGDMIVGRPTDAAAVQVGQVISFRAPGEKGLTTHRVKEIISQNGQLYFVTQGDANSIPDLQPIPGTNVVATFGFRIPYFGYLLTFARHWTGLVVLVIIPSLLLMASEASRLLRLTKDEGRAQPE